MIDMNNELSTAMRRFAIVFGDIVPLQEFPKDISNEDLIAAINDSIEQNRDLLPERFGFKELENNKESADDLSGQSKKGVLRFPWGFTSKSCMRSVLTRIFLRSVRMIHWVGFYRIKETTNMQRKSSNTSTRQLSLRKVVGGDTTGHIQK